MGIDDSSDGGCEIYVDVRLKDVSVVDGALREEMLPSGIASLCSKGVDTVVGVETDEGNSSKDIAMSSTDFGMSSTDSGMSSTDSAMMVDCAGRVNNGVETSLKAVR